MTLAILLASLLAFAAVLPSLSKAASGYGQIGTTWPVSLSSTNLGYGFAVDPADDSVYVAEETSPVALSGDGTYTFSLRKFSSTGAAGASVSVSAALASATSEEKLELVGIAVGGGRIDLLISRNILGGSQASTAYQLYAFSTTPSGSNLVAPAGVPSTGLLADQTVLGSADTSTALASPSDIDFDTHSGDIVLAGAVASGAPMNAGAVELEAITTAGAVGPRWVDQTGFFPSTSGAARNVALAIGTDGKAFLGFEILGGQGALATLGDYTNPAAQPAILSTGGAGPALYTPGPGHNVQLDQTTEWNNPTISHIALASDDALVWGTAVAVTPSGNALRAVSTLAGEGGGYVAGQASGQCSAPTSANTLVAAGGADSVFVLERNAEAVTEYGPGGSGCIPAATTGMTIEGAVPSGPFAAQRGAPVGLAANVSGANVSSVEWNFGDGSPVTTTEASETEIAPTLAQTHAFSTGGTHTVTATIHTDSIVNPETLTETAQVEVPFATPVALLLAEPSSATVATPVTLDASSSTNLEPGDSYSWVFGDGAVQTTTTPTTTHSYAAAGTYSAGVTIKNPKGESGSATASVTVKAASTPPPAEEHKSNPPATNPPSTSTPVPTPKSVPTIPTKPKLTPKQKALQKCQKLKGKAKTQCVKKADLIGKKKPHPKAGKSHGGGH